MLSFFKSIFTKSTPDVVDPRRAIVTKPFEFWRLRDYGYCYIDEIGTTITLDDFIYKSSTNFTDKQSYLDWVANWKRRYKELTTESRKYKKLRSPKRAIVENISPNDASCKVLQLKDEAFYMLQIRKLAKEHPSICRNERITENE